SLCISRRHRTFHQWPYFNCAGSGRWYKGRDGCCLAEILCLNKEIAAKLFVRLGKWPICYQFLAIAYANARSGGDGLQLRTSYKLSFGEKLFPQLSIVPINLLTLTFSERVPTLLVMVNQQHVLHLCAPLTG